MTALEELVDLKVLVTKVWKARWKILSFQLIAIALTIAAALFWPRTYQSQAQILLQVGRESVGLDPTATATGGVISLQQSGREDEIISAMEVLRSRGLLDQVVSELTAERILGAKQSGEDEVEVSPISYVKSVIGAVVEAIRSIDPMPLTERAAIRLERNLSIDAERKSEVIVIKYEADDPELAQAIVDSIVRNYRTKQIQLHRTEGSKEFFDEQRDMLKKELDQVNETLRSTKNRMGIASIDGQRLILESQLGKVSQDKFDTQQQFDESAAKVTDLEERLKSFPERIASAKVSKMSEALVAQGTQVNTLRLQYDETRAKFTEEHPLLKRTKEQLDQAEARLKNLEDNQTESTDDINPIHRELSIELAKERTLSAGLSTRLSTLIEQEKAILAEIQQLNADALVITELERELGIAERKYLAYSEDLESARMDQALESEAISSVSVVQPASLQYKPVSPSVVLTILLGALATLAGTVMISLLAWQTDDRVHTENELRRSVGVPLLISIPKSKAIAKAIV